VLGGKKAAVKRARVFVNKWRAWAQDLNQFVFAVHALPAHRDIDEDNFSGNSSATIVSAEQTHTNFTYSGKMFSFLAAISRHSSSLRKIMSCTY
jgi:hypothetical protein